MSSSAPILPHKGPLSDLTLHKGIESRDQLLSYLRALPYGRTFNRDDFSLVLSSDKGTCSTKHALFQSIANEQDWSGVELLLVMYKMNEDNTPLIGHVISEEGLDYLPEAHCVLRIDGVEVDVTSLDSDFDRLRNSVLSQQTIKATQVGQWKVDYHKDFLKNWITREKIVAEFEEIWALREKCIQRLSENGN